MKVLAPRIWFGPDKASTTFDPQLIAQAIANGQEIAANEAVWLVK